MKKRTLGLAMCGSFCTFSRVLDAFETLDQELYELVPIMSQASFETDSRFGPAAQFRERLETLCGREIVHTIKEAEPSAEKVWTRFVSLPCTGNTACKAAAGIADGPVTLAAKAHLRNERPMIVAVSTNDALAGKRGKSRHAFEPTRILFCPLRTGQRVQKAALPRRGFHKAAADRRIRALRRTGSADTVRDACWIDAKGSRSQRCGSFRKTYSKMLRADSVRALFRVRLRRTGRDIAEHFFHAAIEDLAQIIQRCSRDIAVMLERVKRPLAERVVLDQRVGRDPLAAHGLPKRVINNDRTTSPRKNCVTYYYIFEKSTCNSRYIGYTREWKRFTANAISANRPACPGVRTVASSFAGHLHEGGENR